MKAIGDEPLSLSALVRLSVSQYAEMAQLLRALQQQMESSPAEYVEEFIEKYAVLQNKVQHIDKLLLERLSQDGGAGSQVQQDLEWRRQLQADILKTLEETLPQATSIKSLLASEIQSLKAGRSALSGYKNMSGGQGRLINKRS